MKYAITLLLMWCTAVANGEEWTPPKNPDPQAILQEARSDASAKRYAEALAKHVWFHENALAIQPAQYGVRLSFALSYWFELAENYPPAMKKLKEVRDEAHQNVLAGKNTRDSFHDFRSINETLGEESLTQRVFEALDAKNSKAAKEVFDLAQPALVRGKAYQLMDKYIDAENDFARLSRNYKESKSRANDTALGLRHLNFLNNKFFNDASTLVAILVLNKRNGEAEQIAALAREASDDAAFHAALDSALKGVVPEPWP